MSTGPAILDRADELAAVGTLLDDIAAGVGGVLVFEGPPGVGKTTLTAAAAGMAEVRGMAVLHATGSELESTFPFGGARQLFERMLAELGDGERARMLEGAAGHAAGALGLADDDGATSDAHAVVHGLYWVAANLAVGEPLLLAVDDAHWLDHGSLRFLHYLARRVEELPIGVVIATRPLRGSSVDASLRALAGETPPLHPKPLSGASVSEIVRHIFGTEPDEAFVAECERASGGNALLVTALVRSLADAGVPPTGAGAASVRAAAPEAVRRRVQAALASLPGSPRALAHAIAILGECDIGLAGELAGLAPVEAQAALGELEGTGLLAEGPALRFAHPLVATAVAAGPGDADRSALHASAARLRSAQGASLDSVAAHLLAALPAGDTWVVERLQEAAEQALAHSAPEAAVAYLKRAVAEPPAPDRLSGVLLELGRAQTRAAQWKDASVSLLRGLASTQDDALRYQLVRATVRAFALAGDYHSAADILEEERSRLAADDPRTIAVDGELLPLAVLDADRRARIASLREHYEREARSGQLDNPTLLVLVGSMAAMAARPRDEVLPFIRRGLGRIDPWEDQGEMISWALGALDACDMSDQVFSLCKPLLAESRARGDVAMNVRLLSFLAYACYRIGRLADAESYGLGAVEMVRDLEDADLLFPNAVLDVLIERGRTEMARELLPSRWTGAIQQHDAMATLMRGRVLAACGEAEEALGLLLAAGEDFDTLKYLHPRVAPWRGLAAPLAAGLGDRWLAQSLAEENLAFAQRTQTPGAIGYALRIHGMVTGDLAALQEACIVLDSHPDLLEVAMAKTELGEAVLRDGRPEDAREPLREALGAAHAAGATALAERARRSLHAAGGRPGRPALAGVEALTPSELHVARLAAEGMTNREIAQALFITLKTVERHLNRVYAKLEIEGRPELRAGLEPAANE